jgi:uncharacterized repeat protein (TIGR03803 family)
LAACAAALAPHPAKAGSSYDLLYSFAPGNGGETPSTPLLQGPSGVFYGATSAGGAHNQGNIYTYTIATGRQAALYALTKTGGAGPDALALGPNGILYGTLQFAPHDGAIFSMDPATGTFTTLYTFKPSRISKTGFYPGAIAVDRNNTVYGQTFLGGPGQSGTVFQLRKNGSLKVLLTFNSAGGSVPGPITLIGDALYGAICETSTNTGSLYKIPTNTGTPQTLYQFTGGADGGCPTGAVTPAGNGLIDGIASAGGSNNAGVIYQITESTGAETILFNFPAKFAPAPNAILPVHGTTIYGVRNYPGGVFAFDTATQKVTQLGGTQGEQDLQSALPLPGLIEDSGKFYGVTSRGGGTNVGTLFDVTR